MNALSLGMNAVNATSPCVSTFTAEFGFALRTASTAAVRMSKFFELRSKEFFAVKIAASDFVPSGFNRATGRSTELMP